MMRLLELFWVFFKIGAFTIGGGYAMIPLIKTELVDKKGWVGDDEFFETLAIAQSAPGPIAVNAAVYLGLKIKGFAGLFFATFGAVLPSFLIILAVAAVFENFQNNRYVVAAFKGIKPAVVALILVPVWTLAKKANVKGWLWLLPLGAGALTAYTPVSPIWLVAAAMVGGNLIGKKK